MASNQQDNAIHGESSDATTLREQEFGEGLVVLGQGLAPLNGLGGAAGAPQTPEILTNPLDPIWLLHSFRRRWVLACGLGMVVGAALAALVWHLTPSTVTSVASILVSSRRQIFVTNVDFGDAESDTYKKTQLDYIQSPLVLYPALQNLSSDGSLPSVIQNIASNDQVRWLKENIKVGYPRGAEMMTVALECELAEEGEEIVNAVVTAYLFEVVYKEQERRARLQNGLKQQLERKQQDLNLMKDNYIRRADSDPSSPDSGVARNQLRMELDIVMRTKEKLDNQIMSIDYQVSMLRKRMSDPRRVDDMADAMVENAPEIQAIQMMLNDLAVVYANEAAVSKTINSRPLDNLRRRQESLNQMMAQTRQQLKPNIKNQLLTDPYGEGQQRIQELEESKAYFQAMNAEFDEQIAELNNQLKLSLQQNLGLQEQKAQIERTQRMVDGMATRLQALEVEQDAPERIQKLEDAVSIPGYNTMQRIIMVTMAAMFGLALSCFGVALLDFRHRKLNSPTQMDQGLGIRVLGVLPRLAIRKSASADSVLAVLTESIDNVRTSLMHSSTSSKTQIVMITSAGEHEGRTTVASQLAASLARAGRRTLLVDGDLRHPSLDRLFDVPLADGLCELLRAEVDVADAVRPTNAEGLWLLTAGFCDVAAVQALAREQAQPIFDKLREEFDFVIIDSAPVLNMSDSLIMGQYTDGAVLSVVRDYSRAPKIYEASDRLKRVGVRVLGCVVNGVSAKPSHRVERLWIESAESAASNS